MEENKKEFDSLDINDENLKDITASFLVSLNIAISYLYNIGYKKRFGKFK